MTPLKLDRLHKTDTHSYCSIDDVRMTFILYVRSALLYMVLICMHIYDP